MPIKVTGFLSRDGNFFTSECEARVHDAEMEIRAYCAQQRIDGERVLSVVEALADPILEYVNASQELRDEKVRERETRQEDRDGTVRSDSSLDTADAPESDPDVAVQSFETDRSQSVSDLGSGASPTPIHDERPRSRSRSRRDNA